MKIKLSTIVLCTVTVLASVVLGAEVAQQSKQASSETMMAAPAPMMDKRVLQISSESGRIAPALMSKAQAAFNRKLPGPIQNYTLAQIEEAGNAAALETEEKPVSDTNPSALKKKKVQVDINIKLSRPPVITIVIRW